MDLPPDVRSRVRRVIVWGFKLHTTDTFSYVNHGFAKAFARMGGFDTKWLCNGDSVAGMDLSGSLIENIFCAFAQWSTSAPAAAPSRLTTAERLPLRNDLSQQGKRSDKKEEASNSEWSWP